MCIPHAVPDPNGDFVAPARVFQPKPSRSTSSASSHRHYTTSERSPRPSTSYTVPPPPAKQQIALVERRSPRKKRQDVPPPLIVQEVGPPKPAHRDSGFILPPADPPAADVSPLSSSPDYPPSLKHRTSVRRPKTSPSRANGSAVPPAAPDAPPAVREQHHYHHHHYYNPPPSSYHHRDASHSSDSTRGRSSTRYSSASRSPHTPHFPARTNSTSGRSDRHSTAASEPEPLQAKPSEQLSAELPRRSASTRSTRYLEPARWRDPIVIQNRDGTRVKQYYYA